MGNLYTLCIMESCYWMHNPPFGTFWPSCSLRYLWWRFAIRNDGICLKFINYPNIHFKNHDRKLIAENCCKWKRNIFPNTPFNCFKGGRFSVIFNLHMLWWPIKTRSICHISSGWVHCSECTKDCGCVNPRTLLLFFQNCNSSLKIHKNWFSFIFAPFLHLQKGSYNTRRSQNLVVFCGFKVSTISSQLQ